MEKNCLKRDLLLDAGRKLFWKYGIRRVTTDDICKEAGISRMTFYRCFNNKTDLVKAIYSNLVDKNLVRFFEIIKSEESSSEKMKKLIMLKMESTEDISREFLLDMYDSPGSELHLFVEETNKRIWVEIIEGFRYAQDKGMFRKNFRPEFLMIMSQKLAAMITDKELLQLYDNPGDLIMELINLITYGITPES